MLPICGKVLYCPTLLNLPRIRALVSDIMQHDEVDKFSKSECKLWLQTYYFISEVKHEFKTMLGVIRGLVLNFVLVLCDFLTKYLLHVTSTRNITQDTLYIIWCLLNINNNCMQNSKMGNIEQAFIKYILCIFTEK